MDRNSQDTGQPPPESRDQQGGKPLSQTIPDAHASGDGSLERQEDATVKPRKTTEGDEAIKKEPENY